MVRSFAEIDQGWEASDSLLSEPVFREKRKAEYHPNASRRFDLIGKAVRDVSFVFLWKGKRFV
jgi:hypothetical protein